jgi:hypothetical protein
MQRLIISCQSCCHSQKLHLFKAYAIESCDKPHALHPIWPGLLRVVVATIALSWPTVVKPGSTLTGARAPSVVYTSS